MNVKSIIAHIKHGAKIVYRTSEYAIEQALGLLKILLGMEETKPGIMDLTRASKLNFKTVRKYISALEQMGLLEVIPTERKNIVRLTDKGRCIARCLIT